MAHELGEKRRGPPPERIGRPAAADLVERRRAMGALDGIQIMDQGATARARTVANVRCIEVTGPDNRGELVYAHGGGFRLGEAKVWTGLASRLAVATGLRIILPDYRLAPEHPFPNALHDLIAVYKAICADSPSRVFVGGDSAGGGLACGVILEALATDGRRPDGAILFSPWLDLSVSAQAYSMNAATDRAFSLESALEAAEQYLQGESAEGPYASPLLADLTGFPPVLCFASASEVLADDTLGLIRQLARAGVGVEAHILPQMPHVWPVLMPGSPNTTKAIDAVGGFVRSAGKIA